MAQLILHIGAHKTATTSIQKLLADSATELGRSNIIYPRVAWFQHAQHRLAFGLKRMTDPAARDIPDPITEIGRLNEVLRNTEKRVLVSSEELFTLPPESLEILKAQLVADSVRIVACLRRPDEMLLSIYNQKAKTHNNGFVRPIEYFVNHPRMIDPDISYGQQLGKWIDAFGSEALNVFLYEERSPIKGFFAQLGIPTPTRTAPAVNASVSAPVVEIMRLAKVFDFDPSKRQALYGIAQERFSNAPRMSLSADARRAIIAKLQPEYDAVFRRLGWENPYTVANLEMPEDADPRPNLTYRDLFQLIETMIPA